MARKKKAKPRTPSAVKESRVVVKLPLQKKAKRGSGKVKGAELGYLVPEDIHELEDE